MRIKCKQVLYEFQLPPLCEMLPFEKETSPSETSKASNCWANFDKSKTVLPPNLWVEEQFSICHLLAKSGPQQHEETYLSLSLSLSASHQFVSRRLGMNLVISTFGVAHQHVLLHCFNPFLVRVADFIDSGIQLHNHRPLKAPELRAL